MIRGKVKDMLVEQRVITQGATIAGAMTAFTRVLQQCIMECSAGMLAVFGGRVYPSSELIQMLNTVRVL